MSTVGNRADLADKLRPVARVQQIIVAALAAGVLMFAGVSAYVREFGRDWVANGLEQFLPALAIAFAVAAIVASWWLPRLITRQSRSAIARGTSLNRQAEPVNELQKLLVSLGDVGALCGAFQTQTIISAALLEGAAFFNCLAYLLTGNLFSLGTTLLLAAAIAAKITTPARLVDWVEGQSRLMQEEKLLTR